ncbi:unnamed protein product [Fraxinus pennsylvanica]|uniref:Reverse transcriptase domain-containing protein n=1 Tax=Fraxinus pennsylvanica TaxID=56036 RepID=A0AAD1ZKA2_9LAMI|nr:unnamed protein product [Fraxinus pennsylvanica]
MDGYSGYNQIYITEEDIHKTAFRCPGSLGRFEWVVISFGLKNAGATYQRAMNLTFHDMIDKFVEVYVDDIVVKSIKEDDHFEQLRCSFERMRQYKLKLNPLKCTFGLNIGNFLSFLVHKRRIELDKNKVNAILEAKPPNNKKELRRFRGQVNFLRRFISNCAGRTKVFSSLLNLKNQDEFVWKEEHQKAFESLKTYLSSPPVLVSPIQ